MSEDWKSKYDVVEGFSEGLAACSLNGRWGYFERSGRIVAPLKYDEVLFFHNGFSLVWLDGLKGYIDKEGNEYWDMTEDEARRQMKNRQSS